MQLVPCDVVTVIGESCLVLMRSKRPPRNPLDLSPSFLSLSPLHFLLPSSSVTSTWCLPSILTVLLQATPPCISNNESRYANPNPKRMPVVAIAWGTHLSKSHNDASEWWRNRFTCCHITEGVFKLRRNELADKLGNWPAYGMALPRRPEYPYYSILSDHLSKMLRITIKSWGSLL